MKENAEITVVGMGPGAQGLLTGEAKEKLLSGKPVFLRTDQHPIVVFLEEQGFTYESFDYIYDQEDSFGEVYKKIVDNLIQVAKQKGSIVYAVPGHPSVAESTVGILQKEAIKENVTIKTVAGMSFLDAIYWRIGVDPTEGLQIMDGLVLNKEEIAPQKGLIICQVYNRRVASEVKLTLMELYPDEWEITVIKGAGIPDVERVESIPLYELDRLDWLNHLVTIYLPPLSNGKSNLKCEYPMDPIVDVMAKLRGEGGCPWDREQTHESLKRYLIEETYEVVEAIEENNMNKICDELGDLLLQIVFHAQIGKENHVFDILDVVQAITDKMIRRHPHVFSDECAETADKVLANWEEIKKQERADEGDEPTILQVPNQLPALMRAEKLQAKAAKVGFDWPDSSGVWEKLQEEIQELDEALRTAGVGSSEVKNELGDILFALCNLARWLKIDPEEALRSTCNKFTNRFQFIEREVMKSNKKMEKMTLAQLDNLWNEAKKVEKS
ncbi:tetrapyrrole methylase family protein/MazG family protein [Desulfitispora alkaliphila]